MEKRIKLKKSKGILPKKGILKLLLPKITKVMVNLVQVGPRVILRGAFQLLRANIWTRLVSTVVIVAVDSVQFLRKRISKKQFSINLLLSFSLLFGGAAGWVAGTNSVLGVAAENTAIWIIAGIAGAGIFSAGMDFCCKKIIGKFIKNDVEDMLDLINSEFDRMINEAGITREQADKLAAAIQIDDKVCVQCYEKSNKQKYIRHILQPHFNDADAVS